VPNVNREEFAKEWVKEHDLFQNKVDREADALTEAIKVNGSVSAMGIKEETVKELTPLLQVDPELRMAPAPASGVEEEWSEKQKTDYWDKIWKNSKEAVKTWPSRTGKRKRSIQTHPVNLTTSSYKTSFWYPTPPAMPFYKKSVRPATEIIQSIVNTIQDNFRMSASVIAGGMSFQAMMLQEQGEIHARYTRLYGRVRDSPDPNLRCGTPDLKQKCAEARRHKSG
jgi:hypothetical protein